jgi:cytochrome P450
LKLLPAFRRDAAGTLLELFRRFGDVSQFHFGRRLNTVIAHPDHLRHVLIDNADNYAKGIAGEAFRPLLGDGLLAAEGELWRRHRDAIQPAFRSGALASYCRIVVDEAAKIRQAWQNRKNTGRLDLSAEMNRLAFSFIARSLFGIDPGTDRDAVASAFETANREGTHRLRSVIKPPLDWPTAHNKSYAAAVATVRSFATRQLGKRRRDPGESNDLLAILASPETGIPESEAVDEIVTLLFAGHETTTNALAWTFGLLACHRGALEKARAEIGGVLGGRDPTVENIAQLSHVRAVFQEAMRLYPPIYAFQRRALEPDRIGSYDIPRNSGVTISAYITHRHPGFWNEPEVFDPERFADGRTNPRHRLAYIPFGAGPRTCIGANLAMIEGVAILASLLPHFDFTLAMDQLPAAASLISLAPRGGMPMIVTPRAA